MDGLASESFASSPLDCTLQLTDAFDFTLKLILGYWHCVQSFLLA